MGFANANVMWQYSFINRKDSKKVNLLKNSKHRSYSFYVTVLKI